MLMLISRELSNWSNPEGKNVRLKLTIKGNIKIGVGWGGRAICIEVLAESMKIVGTIQG